MLNDNYNRTIILTTSGGIDSYFVDDGQGNTFTVSCPAGTDWGQVSDTINSMAPPAAS